MPATIPIAPGQAATTASRRRFVLSSGPILVATDGTHAADAALRVASALADRLGTSVEVLSVVDPVPVVAPEVQLPLSASLETERRALRLATVHAQIARVTGSETTWRTELRTGQPAAVIARRALDLNAPIIIAGLGRHAIVDRLFGTETVLQLVRMATVPVLAVPEGQVSLPKKIVVGTDFSVAATRAARVGMELAEDESTVYLTHTVSRDINTATWEQWQEAYTAQLADSFKVTTQRLAIPEGMSFETRILHGDPAHELLHFAGSVGADLIVVGSHGHGFFSRMLLGGVATHVVRGASCAVLVVPRGAASNAGVDGLTEAERGAETIGRSNWAAVLDTVSRVDNGRRVSLQVDDPEIGAQAQDTDYPFLGASYDRHDGHIEVMLGERGIDGRHVTRSIGDVTAMDILRNSDGTTRALRIAHGLGHTLLTFA